MKKERKQAPKFSELNPRGLMTLGIMNKVGVESRVRTTCVHAQAATARGRVRGFILPTFLTL